VAVAAFATCGSVAVYDQVCSPRTWAATWRCDGGAGAARRRHPLSLALASSPAVRRERLERLALSGRFVADDTPVALACYVVVIVGSHLTA